MCIRELENALGGRYVGRYPPGHRGCQILRFRRESGNADLVAKFAPLKDAEASSDLAANVTGYRQLDALGAGQLIPPELRLVELSAGRALVMRDLGENTRSSNVGISAWNTVGKNFESVARATLMKNNADHVDEVLFHLRKFVPGNVLDPRFENLRRHKSMEYSALMLLDFTPDNVFISGEQMWFLDPWEQKSYRGHPAVSLGQFATLLRIYGLRDAQEALLMFRELAVGRFSAILHCDEEASAEAFRLGQTLQLVLSAFVRRDEQPPRARELYREALALWD